MNNANATTMNNYNCYSYDQIYNSLDELKILSEKTLHCQESV